MQITEENTNTRLCLPDPAVNTESAAFRHRRFADPSARGLVCSRKCPLFILDLIVIARSYQHSVKFSYTLICKMKSSTPLFITLFTASVILMHGRCDEEIRRPRRSAQILGFSWENCGKPDDPAVLKALKLSPDPITIPGDLTASASGSTSVALVSPLSVNVTLEKEVAGIWVKIPCVEEMGSCHYPDGCDILNQLVPPGQDCPEPLRTYGLPCHCPFKAGDYSLPQSDFYVPNIDLPFWLTNGNYRVQGVLGSAGKELGCLKVSLTIHSG